MQKRWLKSPQLWDPGVGGHARNVQVFLIRRDLSQQDQNDNPGLAWPKVRLEEMNITRVYGISWVIRSFRPTRMLSSQPEKEVKKVHRLQTLALMCQAFPVWSGDTAVPGTSPSLSPSHSGQVLQLLQNLSFLIRIMELVKSLLVVVNRIKWSKIAVKSPSRMPSTQKTSS